MTTEQHVELPQALRRIDGMVVMSGYPSALYDGLLTGWSRRETTAYTCGGRERVECVWLNPACARRLAARDSPVSAA
jgi:DNA adenine methylase